MSEAEHDAPGPGARTGRRKLVMVSVAAGVLTIGGLVATALPGGGHQQPTATGLPTSTAPVRRGDLSNSTRCDGTLGFARPGKVTAGTAGTLTKLPSVGDTVKRGGILYELNGHPVRLMYGQEPMYRTLKAKDEGKDVRQLKQNLMALGFGPGLTADATFTPGTADAVKRWQKAGGLRQTGEVGPDQIAFAPGAVRVDKVEASPGDQAAPGRPVLTTTGSDRVVEVRMDASASGSLKEGTKAVVTLPDGSTAPAKVSSIGRTATDDGKDGQDKTPKVTVTLAFDDPDKVKGIDQAPVAVDLAGQTHRDVLSVPVNALLALARRIPGSGHI
ncbi:peptidoglycan-binding protein [Streptomyces violascens]|uniref:peptidoglycan-binding protein n=1 Tax=Streptomyces violascens TaxID=67381 RepID=UPI003665E45D